MKNSIVKHG